MLPYSSQYALSNFESGINYSSQLLSSGTGIRVVKSGMQCWDDNQGKTNVAMTSRKVMTIPTFEPPMLRCDSLLVSEEGRRCSDRIMIEQCNGSFHFHVQSCRTSSLTARLPF
jgi:hypothetical protein